MGVDYYQNAIVGVKFSSKEIKRVVSPAVYEDQPRYDTKTGKIKRHEKVLVKEEEAVYSIGHYDFSELWDIGFKNKSKLKVEHYKNEDDFVYIGLEVLSYPTDDMNFLFASISLSKLSDTIDEVREELRKLELYDLMEKVELHFFTIISF